MKYLTIIITIGLALCFILKIQAQVDPKTVVGAWLFDSDPKDGVNDSSPNGHHGEIKGNVKWVNGKFGNALEFPGVSGSLVSIPPTPDMDLFNFTILLWYKGEATGSWQYIVSKEIPHNSRNYSIGVNTGNGVLVVQITVNPEQWKTAQGRTDLTTNEWFHMAGTYDGKMIKGYVNGVLEAQAVETGKPDNPKEEPLRIGAVNGIPTKGVVDDVALFNVALEEEDIIEIMNNGLQKTLNLVSVESSGKLAMTWGDIKKN